MIAFIDDHRGAYGVEPICEVLPIAPSTYHTHAARRADPSRLPARAKRDASLMPEIARVFEENFPGLWRAKGLAAVATQRPGSCPLHCWAPDANDGFARCCPWQAGQDHDQRQGGAVPAGPREPAVQGTAAERTVGLGQRALAHEQC